MSDPFLFGNENYASMSGAIVKAIQNLEMSGPALQRSKCKASPAEVFFDQGYMYYRGMRVPRVFSLGALCRQPVPRAMPTVSPASYLACIGFEG